MDRQEWSVRIEASGPGPLDADRVSEILGAEPLAGRGPALSIAGDRVGLRFDVQAGEPLAAVRSALVIFSEVLPGLTPVEVEAKPVDQLERELEESNAPELMGVSEVAAALHVSKQRAAELAEREDFPKPIERLRAGPIWQRSAVARFIGRWPRRPGRPRGTTTKTQR